MLLAQVVLAHVNGIAKDSFVNTFAIGGGADTAVEAADAATRVAEFYTKIRAPHADPLGVFFNLEVSRASGAHQVRMYNHTDLSSATPAGSPIHVGTFTMPARHAGGMEFPSEVAVAITLEGSGRSTAAVEGAGLSRPKSRRTGRVYIGPLTSSTSAMTGNVVRVDAGYQSRLRLAALGLNSDLHTGGMWLGVWSRADQALREIEAVSTDDAFDTIRSRGPKASARVRSLSTETPLEVVLAA